MARPILERTISDYADLLGQPHHDPVSRPRMDRLNRAGQFAPYAALTGFGDLITEAGRLTDQPIAYDEETCRALDEQLSWLMENEHLHPKLTVVYFVKDESKEGGAYREHTGLLRRIDPVQRIIFFGDGFSVPLNDVASFLPEGEG